MSVTSVDSTSRTKTRYPLRMETIPIVNNDSVNKDNIFTNDPSISKGNTNNNVNNSSANIGITKDGNNKPFESDENFKFKRHQSKNIKGFTTLGEKLDILHSKVTPKRIENFDSSYPVNPTSNIDILSSSHRVNHDSKSNSQLSDTYSNHRQNKNSIDDINSDIQVPGTQPDLSKEEQNIMLNPPTLLPNTFGQNIINSPIQQQHNSQDIYSTQPNQQQPMYPMYYIPIPTSPVNPNLISNNIETNEYKNNNTNNTNNTNNINNNIIKNGNINNIPQLIPVYPNLMNQQLPSSYPAQFLPPSSFGNFYGNNSDQIDKINNKSHNNSKNRKNRRRSLSEQRGRRLSIVSNREHSVILPHKDIPIEQYYRHLADLKTSDKLKQLFAWCSTRSMDSFLERNINTKNKFAKLDNNQSPNNYLDSKKISLNIIKKFIKDFNKGKIDIDWNDYHTNRSFRNNKNKNNDASSILLDSKGNEISEDPEIKELFQDDDDDDEATEDGKNDLKNDLDTNSNENEEETYFFNGLEVKKVKIKRRKLNSNNSKKIIPKRNKKLTKRSNDLLPNPKNAENEKNLKLLNDKIDKLKQEIDKWKIVLDNENPELDWKYLHTLSDDNNLQIKEMNNELQSTIEEREKEIQEIFDNIKSDFDTRLERLKVHSHLYYSHSSLLSKITLQKINLLSKEFCKRQDNIQNTKTDTLDLLEGLSQSLTEMNRY